MKIYMDNCCYYRPFDDQAQDRIRLETDAIVTIVARCEAGDLELIGSDILKYEMSKVSDFDKYKNAATVYKAAKSSVPFSTGIQRRANHLQRYGIKSMDALHLASAESGGAEVYLTTDDNLIKWAKSSDTKLNVINPVRWIMEVMENE